MTLTHAGAARFGFLLTTMMFLRINVTALSQPCGLVKSATVNVLSHMAIESEYCEPR